LESQRNISPNASINKESLLPTAISIDNDNDEKEEDEEFSSDALSHDSNEMFIGE